MKPSLPAIVLLILFAFSCSHNRKIIYLRTENVDGLSVEAPVEVNGYRIGSVEKIGLQHNGEISIRIVIKEPIQIPLDSKFVVESADLLGTKNISVKLGKDNKLVSDKDTLDLVPNKGVLVADSFVNKVGNFIKNLSGQIQRDSMLYELRRLNENLERQQGK